MVIGTLTGHPLVQTVIISILLLAILINILINRPYRYLFSGITEFISYLCLLVGTAAILILASYDDQGCVDCGGREGWMCWLIVPFFFMALFLGFLGLAFEI